MKAQDLLPDGKDHAEFDGVTVRKGSVGAFIANATLWMDPAASAQDKHIAEQDMVEALPALRALRLFELFSVRNESLRHFVDRH
jgi:hypothetical protein